jgi:hypothetical protein
MCEHAVYCRRLDLGGRVADFSDVLPIIDNHIALLQGYTSCQLLKHLAVRMFDARGRHTPAKQAKTAISLAVAASPCDIDIRFTFMAAVLLDQY